MAAAKAGTGCGRVGCRGAENPLAPQGTRAGDGVGVQGPADAAAPVRGQDVQFDVHVVDVVALGQLEFEVTDRLAVEQAEHVLGVAAGPRVVQGTGEAVAAE